MPEMAAGRHDFLLIGERGWFDAMSYSIPTRVETKRLVLRIFKDQDWRDMHALYSDAECTRFTIQRVLTEGESWRAMAGLIGHWQIRGYGPYAVQDKISGRVMGSVGLWYPNDWPEPEIKWSLARAYWHQGYASEAARAVKRIALKYLPDLSLISLIFEANENSKQLAVALGAVLERETVFRGQPSLIFRHQLS